MKLAAVVCSLLLLAGCQEPAKQPRELVSCASPDGSYVQTGTYDFWEYEGGGWHGYSYDSGLSVTVHLSAVYVPLAGSVCHIQEVR